MVLNEVKLQNVLNLIGTQSKIIIMVLCIHINHTHFSILVESEDVLLGEAEELEVDSNSVDLDEELIG